MNEVELLKYNGLIISIRSNNEEILEDIKVLKFLLFSNLEYQYRIIKITINDDDFRFYFMCSFEYVDFDLVLDASHIPDNIKFYMKIFGDIKPVSSENRITTFHFEFDERGDKARIYDSYKMCDIIPYWMIYRAVKDKDNKFIKWLICSYPDDIIINSCLMEAIIDDNAEAFHLFEQIDNNLHLDSRFLMYVAEKHGRPEYAEYIRNHY